MVQVLFALFCNERLKYWKVDKKNEQILIIGKVFKLTLLNVLKRQIQHIDIFKRYIK
jgi:hypothetical protein